MVAIGRTQLDQNEEWKLIRREKRSEKKSRAIKKRRRTELYTTKILFLRQSTTHTQSTVYIVMAEWWLLLLRKAKFLPVRILHACSSELLLPCLGEKIYPPNDMELGCVDRPTPKAHISTRPTATISWM